MDNLEARGQEDEVMGLPSLNINSMMGITLPTEFEFEGVFGDIIMCEIIDENDHGEIFREGIWVKQDITQKLWRRGLVVLKGPKATEIDVGDQVAYPSDRGIPMVSASGKKYIFLSTERLFGKLKPIEIPK